MGNEESRARSRALRDHEKAKSKAAAGRAEACQGDRHHQKPFTCMSQTCQTQAMICANYMCGFKSVTNPKAIIC